MPQPSGTANYIQNVKNIKLVRCIVESCKSERLCKVSDIIVFYARKQLSFYNIEAPFLIDNFLAQSRILEKTVQTYPNSDVALNADFDFSCGEDVLGFLYMLLSPLKKRKKNGAYYTKSSIAKSMVQSLSFDGKTLVDMCCGTGVFLLESIKQGCAYQNVYGYDSDPVAVFITRVNMLCVCGKDSLETVLCNITCMDSLMQISGRQFDIVIGNPPWGYHFEEKQTKMLRDLYKLVPAKGRIESFKLFTERSVELLTEGGMFALVLPEAMLTVRIHQDVRKFLLERGSFTRIIYWGNTFSRVLCPSVSIIFIKGLAHSCVSVVTETERYTVQTPMTEKSFNYHVTEKSQKIIDEVYNSRQYITLKNNARFAMGIVTGNNKKYVLSTPNEFCEPIYRGKDIVPFRFLPPKYFIDFNPNLFQQTAPSELFRQPKIVYRFVSKSLICTYDKTGSLLLNSANFFVPSESYSPYAIVCLLNSNLYTFLYQNLFCAAKVLRCHLESLPFPLLNDSELQMFKQLYEHMKISFDRKLLNQTISSFFYLEN